ncbi:hypothetical protein Cni_G05887 [Canna indica]|uniref:O-fucosyltransferase family protein n=1 Tax=Canna indica TaxID=4628 RepID=A0AAQ3Q5Z6_9LILI|nr:hypothetical protein Cni_G05887 [Canna indica]
MHIKNNKERKELQAYREIHFPTLTMHLKNNNSLSPEESRSLGKCPLTPEEEALGYNHSTYIYLAGSHIYGGQSRMLPFTRLYPNVITKEDILTPSELAPFKNYSSQVIALDFIACATADVFAMTDSSSQLSSLVTGYCIYHGRGHAPTIRPNKKRFARILSENRTLQWVHFEERVRKMIQESVHQRVIARRTVESCVEMAEGKPKSQSGVWSTVKPFVNGGASGMLATCIIQPIDMVKVRIQLGQGSAVQVTKNMLANEGFGSLYKGLSAGLLRQATYTTARLGSFRVLTNKAVEANDGKPLPLLQKAAIGLTAGAIGACVGSPADLALIRMQADATLPAAQRRNYKNAFHALYRIVADEGVLALWKGAGPTVVRAMALNMGMLASYDQSVELFRDSLGFGEISTVLGASAVSGFFASACSLPFDYVKTQIQKMQPDATGKYPYTGSLDCAMKTLNSGGPFKFYTGFPVYCVRIAPHVMMTWIFLNQIQKVEKSLGL